MKIATLINDNDNKNIVRIVKSDSSKEKAGAGFTSTVPAGNDPMDQPPKLDRRATPWPVTMVLDTGSSHPNLIPLLSFFHPFVSAFIQLDRP
jgi:hypothetical protein